MTGRDGRAHTSATTVRIDHTVPVHEAWGSGARSWTRTRRVAFYDDLGDRRALNAQTSALNSSTGARGPEPWLPAKNRCGSVGEWAAVKIGCGLKVDSKEKSALTRLAASCPNVTPTVKRARLHAGRGRCLGARPAPTGLLGIRGRSFIRGCARCRRRPHRSAPTSSGVRGGR